MITNPQKHPVVPGVPRTAESRLCEVDPERAAGSVIHHDAMQLVLS